MGLKPSEQQALCSIEGRITGSDPGLASMLAMFTRLTGGEASRTRESIRPRRLRAGSSMAAGVAGALARDIHGADRRRADSGQQRRPESVHHAGIVMRREDERVVGW